MSAVLQDALQLLRRTQEGTPAREDGAAREPLRPRLPLLPSGHASLEELLPDGGIPRGAVVEIASPHGLARATSFALATCAAAQAEATLRGGGPRSLGAFCAFIDPWSTLHAPAVLRHSVDLERLLVVRPPLDALARVAVRMAESRAFAVLVIDTVGPPGAVVPDAGHPVESSVRLDRWSTVVRRLALAVERTDTALLLLTDVAAPRPLPLPVALRLELARSPTQWQLRVAKDRHGRVRSPVAITAQAASG